MLTSTHDGRFIYQSQLQPEITPLRLLDRYVFLNFLLPFVYCLFGFFSIWLVFDLESNLQDFIESRVAIGQIAYFYLTQIPSIAVIMLPVGLLLALLYSLGRMSTSNEIISMLSAGISLERILFPFFIIGLTITGISAYLNYELAPQADGTRDQILAEMEQGAKLEKRLYRLGHLFLNRADERLWYVEKLPTDQTKPLQGVQVVELNRQGDILSKYYAHSASYDPAGKAWHLFDSKYVKYAAGGEAASYSKERVVTGWSETPYRIGSSMLEADKLTIPELRHYLDLNSDFTAFQLAPFRTYLEYRWAVPWTCLVVVCVGAPLGIVFSRRSVVKGVAWAIGSLVGILFLQNLCAALGRGGRISPVNAAWIPNILFGIIGLLLLRMRSLNRDRLPLTPRELWHYVTGR